MSIRQADYGSGGDSTELVPGGLRVYRHYRIEVNGTLLPTTTCSDKVQPGVNEASCRIDKVHGWSWGYPRPVHNCPKCQGRGFVMVRKVMPRVDISSIFASRNESSFDAFLSSAYDYVVEEEQQCDCIYVQNQDCTRVPNIKCSCGFYASYSPGTDFFEGMKTHRYGLPLPPVFAAVEASGRVLMGTKGVRAEKMRVVALALDEEHMTNTHYFKPSKMGETHYALELAAEKYQVTSFGWDLPAMVEAYPPPDLSNIIENQES